MDRLEIYDRGFVTSMRALPADYENSEDTKGIEKVIFYGVRLISQESNPQTVENLFQQFAVAEGIMGLMTFITPRKFVELFPIEKEYDGNRWGTKDYFYTVRMIEKHGWDELISSPDNFLWDYVNRDITSFMVKYMCLASDMRRAQGQPGIMEEWAAMNNIPTYTLHTASDGQQYILNPDGRTLPVKKPRPKHLKVVDYGRVKGRG